MTAVNELFIEIYNCFEHDVPAVEEIQKIIYWYISDLQRPDGDKENQGDA